MKRKPKLPLIRARLVETFRDIEFPASCIHVKASELQPIPIKDRKRGKAVQS